MRLAFIVHYVLYLLPMLVIISGYFISTADGRAISIFGLFEIPAVLSGQALNQEDIAGAFHWYLALSLIAITAIHATAALKHHFVDKDRTLLRIFGIRSRDN